MPGPDFITIGQAVAAHGLQGELRVNILSDFPKRFLALQHVYLCLPPVQKGQRDPAVRAAKGAPNEPREYKVMTARLLGGGNKRLFPVSDPADEGRSGPWAGQTNQALVKLGGVNDPETATSLRGYLLQLHSAEAWPLPDDTFYAYQIEGLPVVTAGGRSLGIVEELIATGSNDVYLVRTPAGNELLVPAIRDVVLEIDPGAGYIRIREPAEWSDDETAAKG